MERNWDFSNGILYSYKANKPISNKLFKLANYFNVSTDYLLGITDKRYLLSKDEDKIALKSTLKTAVTLNKELSKKKQNRNENEWGEYFSRLTCITIYK